MGVIYLLLIKRFHLKNLYLMQSFTNHIKILILYSRIVQLQVHVYVCYLFQQQSISVSILQLHFTK